MHKFCLLLMSIPPSRRMVLTVSTLRDEPSNKLHHPPAILARLLAEGSRSPLMLPLEGPRRRRERSDFWRRDLHSGPLAF